jgi:hypothetical protein
MAATVAEAWQQVQQKILPPPLLPSPTPLTHSTLNTKVAAKQQNPFNHVDENKKQHDGTEKTDYTHRTQCASKNSSIYSIIS